ncbi:adenosine deaminase [Geitlerinema splendidum]|nr:adenosine deaminase [Geitlerinema splendidum]
MPKVELHVHMEGSIRPETVLELSRRNSVPLPADTLEGLREWYTFRDFPHFVEVYVAVSKCIRSPQDIEFIARQFLEGQKEQNILHSEVTYTASTIQQFCGIPWDEQIDALERAIEFGKRELGVSMLLIVDIVRGCLAEEGLAVAKMAVSGKDRGVGALGLAGQENKVPANLYETAYDYARAHDLPIIPHAGETQGPDSIWDAWKQTGCQRIGHGVRCLEDPELVRQLVANNVVLEVCPSSNVCLGVVPDLASHPLPKLVEAGLTVTINSDDPPMFSTSLSEEYCRCSEAFGFDEAQLKSFAQTAARHSLLSPEAREQLLSQLS